MTAFFVAGGAAPLVGPALKWGLGRSGWGLPMPPRRGGGLLDFRWSVLSSATWLFGPQMPSGFRCAFRWKRMIAAVTRPLSLPSTGPEYRWREARSRWRRLIQGSTGPCGRAVAEDG